MFYPFGRSPRCVTIRPRYPELSAFALSGRAGALRAQIPRVLPWARRRLPFQGVLIRHNRIDIDGHVCNMDADITAFQIPKSVATLCPEVGAFALSGRAGALRTQIPRVLPWARRRLPFQGANVASQWINIRRNAIGKCTSNPPRRNTIGKCTPNPSSRNTIGISTP